MSESKQNSSVRQVLVDEDDAGQRIDNFLLRCLKGVPKSHIYRILRKGEVRVNKGRIRANYRLQTGDTVRIPPLRLAEREEKPPPGARLLEQLQQAILYEDKRLLVLNKPSGVAVHGGSGLNYGVIEALRLLRPEERQLELVHRLDRDTSGCLLVAKRRSALRTLHELLRQNSVDKRYVALVSGRWEKDRVNVDAPLQKNQLQGGERIVRVSQEGKQAQTLFRVRERFSQATLVEARLVTGRTHQIRVHLAHLGTPIVGDEKYGDAEANRHMRGLGLKRLFLHAESIGLRWPEEKEKLRVEAPLQESLKQLLDKLRNE
jgi:23S rRNA pseudouridine955/2504/2580 synthase